MTRIGKTLAVLALALLAGPSPAGVEEFDPGSALADLSRTGGYVLVDLYADW